MIRILKTGVALIAIAALPASAIAQAGAVVSEVNSVLAQHPSSSDAVHVEVTNGRIVATRSDASGALETWTMYADDVGAVVQSLEGHVRFLCADELGNCVKQTCNGGFEPFDGCRRGSGSVTRHRNEIILEYDYDTRAHARIESAVEAGTD